MSRPTRGSSEVATAVQHDPKAFVTRLNMKLAARSRHVCLFVGAGLGKACGLPDVKTLRCLVLEDLNDSDRTALERQLEGRNIEETLSRIRRIATLLTGDQRFDDLTATRAKALDATVCHAIARRLGLEAAEHETARHIAAWIARAHYDLPIEVFTVNYDLLLETAFEHLRVPYFDGFIGALRARFHTDLVEDLSSSGESMPAFLARLWKLHGSVNWVWTDNQQIVRLGEAAPEALAAAIYPSDAKYEESRRVPFIVLQDRFRRSLHQPETIVLITGYSFGDQHINEHIFDAATRRERSEFVAFCFDDIPDAVASRASITPNLQVVARTEAILAGVRGTWKPPEIDAPGVWSEAEFSLVDVKCLARHLAHSSAPEHHDTSDGGAFRDIGLE